MTFGFGWSYGVAVAWAIGLVVVRRLIRPERFDLASISLGLCVGLIATAVLRYGLQVLGTTAAWTVIVADHTLLFGAIWSLRSSPSTEPLRNARTTPGKRQRTASHLLAWTLMAITLALAIRTTAAQIDANPFGHWDAIAIWNIKAHVLLSGGAQWLDALHATEWPGYPLFVPLTAARLAAYEGSWSAGIAIATSLMFFAATCGLLVGSLSREIGPWATLVALTLYLAPKPVRVFAGAACADIPLGALELATLTSAWRALRDGDRGDGYPRIAGICSAGALFAKDDAIALTVSVAVAFLVGDWLSKRSRRDGALAAARSMTLGYAAAALPALLVMVHFKLSVTSTSWLVAGRDGLDVLHQLLDPRRYQQAWSALTFAVRDDFRTATAILLALAALSAPLGRARSFWIPWSLLTAIIVTQVSAYVLAYVVSPYDVVWHIFTSANRLGLHVWPSIVMLAFLQIFADTESVDGHPRSGARLAAPPRSSSPP